MLWAQAGWIRPQGICSNEGYVDWRSSCLMDPGSSWVPYCLWSGNSKKRLSRVWGGSIVLRRQLLLWSLQFLRAMRPSATPLQMSLSLQVVCPCPAGVPLPCRCILLQVCLFLAGELPCRCVLPLHTSLAGLMPGASLLSSGSWIEKTSWSCKEIQLVQLFFPVTR